MELSHCYFCRFNFVVYMFIKFVIVRVSYPKDCCGSFIRDIFIPKSYWKHIFIRVLAFVHYGGRTFVKISVYESVFLPLNDVV